MSDPSSSSSRPLQATVADEEEELKAQVNGTSGDGDVEMKPAVNGDGVGADSPVQQKEEEGKEERPVEAEPEPVDPNKLPDDACETLYIQNLNEKVLLPGAPHRSSRLYLAERVWPAVLIATLQSLFKPYRPLLPITAHDNVRMRGQAFITFPDVDTANKARKEVNEFPLYGKGMVGPCVSFGAPVLRGGKSQGLTGVANQLREESVGPDGPQS